MSKVKTNLREAVAMSRGQNWMIKWEGGQYLVGYYSRRDISFIVICSCDFYDQAEVICESLKGHIPDMAILEYCEGGFFWQ